MAVWRLITHHATPEEVLTWTLKHGKIGLGWSHIGDIRKFASPAAITERTRLIYPHNKNAPFSGRQLWSFCHEMKNGDLVILSTGGRRACVMSVSGDYEFAEVGDEETHYAHLRPARRVDADANDLWKSSGGMAPGQAIRWSLIRCARGPR